MIVETVVSLPDGRRFNLTLEPKFHRDGHNVQSFVLHAIEDVTSQARQLEIGGDIAEADRRLRLVDGP